MISFSGVLGSAIVWVGVPRVGTFPSDENFFWVVFEYIMCVVRSITQG